MRRVYLDYNATTPVAPEVASAIRPFLEEHFGNPSSDHAIGRLCNEAVYDAREQIGGLIGATADEIVFTGCGTESNNLAILGTMFQHGGGGRGHLIVSEFEHPAVLGPAKHLEQLGFDVSYAPDDENGIVQPEAVENLFREETLLVSVMHSNNEIGSLQPIAEITKLCHANDILMHTDAAQSLGKVRVDVNDLDVDFLTIAGHKLYAPKGIGALYVRSGTSISPILHGAGHEMGMRPGTENVPYIVGLGRAAMLAMQGLDTERKHLSQLRDALMMQLKATLGNNLIVNGARSERLPNTLSAQFQGVTGAELLGRADQICASTGAACHSGETMISATLKAIGLNADQASSTVRLSVGRYTTDEEIGIAANILIDAWEQLRPT